MLGENGTGKSTAIRVLAGQLKPNFGRDAAAAPGWADIVTSYRGSELQPYFRAVAQGELPAAIKSQSVEGLRELPGTVAEALAAAREDAEGQHAAAQELRLAPLMEKRVADLSGGELQRLAVTLTCGRRAGVYVVDESTSFLDARQRAAAARAMRGRTRQCDGDAAHGVAASAAAPYVVVVEHDLCTLDAVADNICVLHGDPGVYGAVSAPAGARRGINNFLAGYLPAENLRFRAEPLSFASATAATLRRAATTARRGRRSTLRGARSGSAPRRGHSRRGRWSLCSVKTAPGRRP